MMATESVAFSRMRLWAALSSLEYWTQLGNRQQIAIARALVTLWTTQLTFWTNRRDQLLGIIKVTQTIFSHAMFR